MFISMRVQDIEETEKIDLSGRNDVTSKIEWLGNPLKQNYPSGHLIYARNVWDLKTHKGRIYIGGGNSSNKGPAPNAGPMPVYSWNPKPNKFIKEFVVDEEQIDMYYSFGDFLFIPGHDSRDSWDLGNFYTMGQNETWEKHRNIPKAIHIYSMHAKHGVLFAGLGINTGGAIAISKNDGNSWKKSDFGGRRIHAFLEINASLYATDVFPGSKFKKYLQTTQGINHTPVLEFDGDQSFIKRPELTADVFFPGVKFKGFQRAKIVKPIPWKTGTVYIGGYIHNDHQYFFNVLQRQSAKQLGL